MPALESNVAGLWLAKQSAKGSAASAPSTNANAKKLRQVGGDISVARADANEAFTDGNRFNDATDFVSTLVGNGAPVVQADPGSLNYLLYLMSGAETVGAATSSVYPHTFNFGPATSSFWFTAWKRVGQTNILRQQFIDCRMSSLRVEGSSANKVVKATPTLFSLDPGVTYATDPTLAVETDKPYLYTEAVGTFTIDGTVFKGHSSFAVVINDNVAPWYGDDVLAYDVAAGQGSVNVEGITIFVDAAGLQQYNKIIYGSASPSAGTRPQKSVYMGSYTFTLTRGAAGTLRSHSFTLSNVHWTPDAAIAPNPSGGPVELAIGAEARTSSGNQLVVVGNVLDAAYT